MRSKHTRVHRFPYQPIHRSRVHSHQSYSVPGEDFFSSDSSEFGVQAEDVYVGGGQSLDVNITLTSLERVGKLTNSSALITASVQEISRSATGQRCDQYLYCINPPRPLCIEWMFNIGDQ